MTKNFLAFRLVCYFKKNGLFKTIRRSFQPIHNSIFRRRFLYYVDQPKLPDGKFGLPENLTVECKNCEKEISKDELDTLAHYRRERIIKYQLKNRFTKGARLWIVKLDGQLVGMVWSTRQTTIEPYYFPLTSNDVHIFDNEIFYDYRGHNINPSLINYVLFALKDEGMVRAYIETRVKNIPEIRSLAKTYFINYSSAVKCRIFGRNIMSWSKPKNVKNL